MAYTLTVDIYANRDTSADYSKAFDTLKDAKEFGEDIVNQICVFDDNTVSILDENGNLILSKKVIDNDWTDEANEAH